MDTVTEPTEPIPTEPAYRTSVMLGADSDVFRPVVEEFAGRLQRNIYLDCPHGSVFTSSEYDEYRRSVIPSSYRGEFHVALFSTVRPTRQWTYTDPSHTAYVRNDDGSRDSVMMAGRHPRVGRGESYDQAADEMPAALERWGEDIGQLFLGLVDMQSLYDFLGMGPDDISRVPTRDAFLFSDALFIPYDLVHYANAGSTEALRIVLGQAALAYRSHIFDGDTTIDIADVLAARRKQAMIARAATFTERLGRAAVATLRSEAEDLHEHATAARQSYLHSLRNARIKMAQVVAIEADHRTRTSVINTRPLTSLVENGTITDLNITDSGLTATTKPLAAYDGRTGALHLIGRMKISIEMLTGTVTFRNQDRQVGGYSDDMHAPHVFSSGTPCAGSFSEMIADLVAKYDWVTLLQMAIAFVETANTDDAAGRWVHNWPFVVDPTEYGYPTYEREVTPLEPGDDPWNEEPEEDDDYYDDEDDYDDEEG